VAFVVNDENLILCDIIVVVGCGHIQRVSETVCELRIGRKDVFRKLVAVVKRNSYIYIFIYIYICWPWELSISPTSRKSI